jgi:hypothetical protein
VQYLSIGFFEALVDGLFDDLCVYFRRENVEEGDETGSLM